MLTGTENTLSALIQSNFSTQITSLTGAPPQAPNCIIQLANAMAMSIIPHLVTNTVVSAGSFVSPTGPVTGTGALL